MARKAKKPEIPKYQGQPGQPTTEELRNHELPEMQRMTAGNFRENSALVSFVTEKDNTLWAVTHAFTKDDPVAGLVDNEDGSPAYQIEQI